MTAMGHSFRTEVESKSHGSPSFLSHHLDAMCPASQEEDEWLDQELERARQQRGGFYRKIVNSRAASARELEDLAASRIRNSSRGSTERDFSGSPSASTSSPPPNVPEPHSSWRFYTSYDNGEWKRHCVPVYKPEEEILRKSPSSDVDKELSPAYESHLRKYRQARASLFDRPARRFPTSTSPQGETTTMRVVSQGNSGGSGGLRSAIGGSTSMLPFGGSSNDIHCRTGGIVEMRNSTPLPTHYHEETTTSETVTTVEGPEPTQRPKLQQDIVHRESPRPKHSNLGYKEKVIIPTKYKSESEIAECTKTKVTETTTTSDEKEKVRDKQAEKNRGPALARAPADKKSDEPSYLGSTFEKFNYLGAPLVKPTFVEDSSKERSKVGTAGKESVEFVKRKPVFDTAAQPTSSVSNKPDVSRKFENDSSVFDKLGQSSAAAVRFSSSAASDRGSLPFEPPSERSAVERDYAMEKSSPKFSTSDSLFQPPRSNKFTSLTDRFDVPVVNSTNESRSSSGLVSAKDENTITTTDSKEIINSGPSKSDGVIFIPVIRVMAPSKEERHTTQFSMDVNPESHERSKIAFDRLTGNEILELDEEKNDSHSAEHHRSVGGAIGKQSIAGQSNEYSILHCDAKVDQNREEQVEGAKKLIPITEIELVKNAGTRNSIEQAVSTPIVKIKPDFSSSTQSTGRDLPIFSSTVSTTSQSQRQDTKPHPDRQSIGEKIIIPSRYKEKGQDFSSLTNENKNTDCGPAMFSSIFKEANGDKLNLNPLSGCVTLINTDISNKQQPDVSLATDGNKKSSYSTTVYETRREKPVFPSDQRFCSTIEVPNASIRLNPFDSDPSKQIDITYDMNRATHPFRAIDTGDLVKTSSPSSDLLRQAKKVESVTMPGLRVGGSRDDDLQRSFVDRSMQPNTSAEDEWVVESAVRY